jgi:AraC-like DNA-binding protein
VSPCQAIVERNENITEIALDGLVFQDSGYFSRIFHRETGMSPEAFGAVTTQFTFSMKTALIKGSFSVTCL